MLRSCRALAVLVALLAFQVGTGPSSADPSPPSSRPAPSAWSAGALAASVLIFTWSAHAIPPTPPKAATPQRGRPPRTLAPHAAGTTTGAVNGYPCGGDLPPCYVLARESGGNPTARNPRSSASGLWQFLDSTWNGYAGFARAYLAPPSIQNDKARLVWAGGAGCSHWSAC